MEKMPISENASINTPEETDSDKKSSEVVESTDLLFSEYSKIVDSINENAKEVSELYKEMFYEKEIDQGELAQAILQRATDLLLSGNERLENAEGKEKEIINELIQEFRKQKEANRRELEEFRKLAKELNAKYKDLYFGFGSSEKKTDDCEDDEEKWENECLLEYEDGFNSYDSQRIREIIETTETLIKEIEQGKDYSTLYIKQLKEKEKGGIKLSEIESSFIKMNERNLIREMGLLVNLKKILPFQIAFERKLEKIIYGKESAHLPNEIFSNMDEEVSKAESKELPEDSPINFPVGISKNIEQWEKVFAGDAKIEKPGIYAYLLWLNNICKSQSRTAKLVVCDSIQGSNFEIFHGKTKEESGKIIEKIGQYEKRYYQEIVDTFGLNNIEITNYEESLDGKEEKYVEYQKLCKGFSTNKIFEDAFLNMIPESIANSSKQEKEKCLSYAIDEVSWILAVGGTKISHSNEARYDAVAAVIRNLEVYTENNKLDIRNIESSVDLQSIIDKIVQEISNKINGIKNGLNPNSFECQYYKKMAESLKKIKKGKNKDIAVGQEKQKIDFKGLLNFSFVSPAIGSRSIGWRRGKKNEQGDFEPESSIALEDPYATRFNDGSFSLENFSNKILALEQEKQIRYVEEVVKPMLIQYFIALDNAPDEYFGKVNKTKKQLLEKCKALETTTDVVNFVREFVIDPASH